MRMCDKILTEQNRTEQNRTEQNRTEQNRTEQNRTGYSSVVFYTKSEFLDTTKRQYYQFN